MGFIDAPIDSFFGDSCFNFNMLPDPKKQYLWGLFKISFDGID